MASRPPTRKATDKPTPNHTINPNTNPTTTHHDREHSYSQAVTERGHSTTANLDRVRSNNIPRRQATQPSSSGTRHAKAQPRRLITAAEYKPLSPTKLECLLRWLPFPLDKNDLAWFRRCFDCFVVGHEPGACKGFMVCHGCHKTGHRSRECRARRNETGTKISNPCLRDHRGMPTCSQIDSTPPSSTSMKHPMCPRN